MSPSQRTQSKSTTDAELVELSIPARPEFLTLPRMTAAAVASRAAFDVEEVEDIRLAIEELCLAVFEGRGDGRLCLRLAIRAGGLEVDCTFEPVDRSSPVAQPRTALASALTEQLLGALTDEHGTDVQAADPRAWFRKVHLVTHVE